MSCLLFNQFLFCMFLSHVYFSFVYLLRAKVLLQKKQHTIMCLAYRWHSLLERKEMLPKRHHIRSLNIPDSLHVLLLSHYIRATFTPVQKHILIDFLHHVTLQPANTDNSRSNDWKHSYMSKSNLFLSPSRIVILFRDPDQV